MLALLGIILFVAVLCLIVGAVAADDERGVRMRGNLKAIGIVLLVVAVIAALAWLALKAYGM